MSLVLRVVALIILLSVVATTRAATEIKVNGLFLDKAVLTVDGKQIFIATGQTKHGVTLIEADEDHAVVKVNGKKQTLLLDKSIAKEYSTPEEIKRHSNSKSHVIQSSIIHQTGNLATFEVEYYFADKLGEGAVLAAKTLYRGKLTEYWAYTYTPIENGRNVANITVAMNEKAPSRYVSDQMQFEILWRKQGKFQSIGIYVMEFIKQWER